MPFTARFVSRVLVTGALCSALLSLSSCCLVFGGCPAPDTAAPRIDVSVSSSNAIETFPGGSLQMTFVGTITGGPTSAALTATGMPTGVTATFSPATITDGQSSVMTMVVPAGILPGQMTFTVTANEVGTNFGITASRAFVGNIKPAFQLTLSGATGVMAGTTENYVVNVVRAAGFNGAVDLSIVPASIPQNAVVALTPATTTGNRADVTINVPGTANAGLWLFKAAGRSGAIVDTVALGVRISQQPEPPDITLAVTPATQTIVPGGSATFDLGTTRNLSSLGMGNITLAVAGVSNGASTTLTPSTTTPGSTLLAVTTTTAIADGSYPLTVTATLGTIVKTVTATLIVATPPDFALTMTPNALTIARNGSAQSTLGIQRTGPVAGVTIDAVSLPAGITMSTNPTAITGLSAASTFSVSSAAVPGTYPIVIRGTAGTLIRTTTVTVTVPAPPPSNVTVQVVTPNVSVPEGGTIKVPIKLTRTSTAIGQLLELRLTGIPIGGNAWIAPSFTLADTATLYVIGGTPGTAKLTVTAALGAFPPSDVANVTVTPSTAPDFAIIPAPQTLNMSTGVYAPMAVEIWRKNGFTAPVSFTATGDIAGQYQFRFSLTQTTGSAVGFDIYASPNVPEGPHQITVRGTSGNIVREVTMTVYISATPYNPYPYYPYGVTGIKPPP